MRTVLVVVGESNFQRGAHIFHGQELVNVEAFIPQPSGERFNHAVLGRPVGANEIQLYSAAIYPLIKHL